ncbi:class I SAM-dependent methyltransferase [Psychroserpens sp. XS_ASV72]|uniref:class I SAM-dependent methyltransferase n=1 Tax=Psychroserpens sp. XS_ASV72 TaxID=3241293 RepID=UPI003514CEC9
MTNKDRHASSFRDPSGHVFLEDGDVKRSIFPIYFKQYEALKTQGIFKKLWQAGLLVKHEELSTSDTEVIIKPEQIPFITYPYEWSFNQYKEAALLTLKIQKFCLDHGFSLKDASAFNVTFHKGKAIFIDTLSFDFYQNNSPWRAYKQFITHFLGPLVLARYHGSQSMKLMSNYIDGIPIKMLSSMLPFKTKLNLFLYSNIHLLAKFEDKHNEDYSGKTKQTTLSKKAQLNIVTSLYDYIKKLELKESTEWGNYYNKTNYSDAAFVEKSQIINGWLSKLNSKRIIDVGGNDGTFVREINNNLDLAIVSDIDNNAVDFNYKTIKKNKETYILPMVLDVLNPSPAVGFENKERHSFICRVQNLAPDAALALALIHHMTLSGNVPFEMSAQFFASFSEYLIIEFPKRSDSWVQRLLNTKGEFKSHFDFYAIEHFESSYKTHFNLIEKQSIANSERVMYLFKTIK